MVFYKVRKPRQRLSSTPIVSEDDLKKACGIVNDELYGIARGYDVFKYEDKSLVAVFEVTVVNPRSFPGCSLPNLMKEVRL